jgi:hypothetical protein
MASGRTPPLERWVEERDELLGVSGDGLAIGRADGFLIIRRHPILPESHGTTDPSAVQR